MKKTTFVFKVNIINCELNYHNQKIRRMPVHDIQKHWTAVSTLLGLTNSIYHDLPHWRSNQWPQNAEPKLYHWAISPHRTQWWDLIRSKQLSSVSVCHVQVFAGFSSHGNSIHNMIPLLKKEKCTSNII